MEDYCSILKNREVNNGTIDKMTEESSKYDKKYDS
jgi:hypothetical protein